jgi:hypothetical protein
MCPCVSRRGRAGPKKIMIRSRKELCGLLEGNAPCDVCFLLCSFGTAFKRTRVNLSATPFGPMLLLLSAALFGVRAAPPLLTTNFCADVQQFLIHNVSGSGGGEIPSNMSWPPGSQFNLCMTIDNSGVVPIPKFARRGMLMDPITPTAFYFGDIFNGTDDFKLKKNASEPGGWSCARTVNGIPKDPTMTEPWAFVTIDTEATSNGTDPALDGVKNVARWLHDRPKMGMHMPGNMTWHVDTSGPAQRLLRTSYVHIILHNKERASGERDFSANFTESVDPTAWAPPPDVACHLPKDAYVPADDCSPQCAADSLCCRDPTVANSTGACFAVSNCAQLPGPGAAAAHQHAGLGSLWGVAAVVPSTAGGHGRAALQV